uniref:Pentatricopeptide repeat-containing protein At3g60050 n=1 Tax=Anthurium amnicola TaxID=1678845 RepID=A0A1D1XE23_9ARAE
MRAAVLSGPRVVWSLSTLRLGTCLSRGIYGDGHGAGDDGSTSSFESSDFGGVPNEVLIGVNSDGVEDGGERDDFSHRRRQTEQIRFHADQVFEVLLQEGPGFSARTELEKLQLQVSAGLVREVLLRILKFIDASNKPRCAKLGLKFFVWAGQRQDYKHTPNEYNLTLKIFAKCEELKAMWRLVDEMTQDGLPTTALTLNILISACGQAGMARKLVERFIKSKTFNYRPFKHSFNAILHSLIIVNHYRLIEWVYQKMLLDGHSPDILTYNVLMCAKYRLGKLDQFHRLLDEMSKNGFAPDLHTYNLLLHVLGKGDRPLAALKLLNYMKDVGCCPSVLHFTTLIDGLSRAGNTKACQYFFDEMVKRGCEPDVVSYTVMITGYVVTGEFDKAQIMFDQMINRGQLPNVLTYNSMIRGLCLAGKYDEACCMLKEVENKGCIPSSSVYRTMISKLRNAGKDSEADEIIRCMEENGYHTHLSSRFRGYRRC